MFAYLYELVLQFRAFSAEKFIELDAEFNEMKATSTTFYSRRKISLFSGMREKKFNLLNFQFNHHCEFS